MKANEAPERIWMDLEWIPHFDCKDCITENSIEYVRKDAFIEEACSWLKNHYRDYMHNPTGKRLEAFFGGDMCNDFESYMKGE